MLESGSVILVSAFYLGLLFLVAYIVNKLADQNKINFISSPLIYTLSLTVYCTSWTFYGAVGSAATNGLEFLTIYIGPSLVFFGWWFLMRKLVRISKQHRITSIADFISSRYGKSTRLAALVTIMAVIGTTPYIALQLKAVATSFNTITSQPAIFDPNIPFYADTGFWVTVSMGIFIVLFGTRRIGVDEHHHGVVAAIALESFVKLFAFLAVGVFVLMSIKTATGGNILTALQDDPDLAKRFSFSGEHAPRWMTMLVLAAAAIICLPRQFQVAVVEITDEKNLRQASWLFPFYLFLISVFVIPIAIAGLVILPSTSNPDQFLLTLPMQFNQDELALLAFIGGFSSATSMMIMATMALSIMISNQLVIPFLLRFSSFKMDHTGDLMPIILRTRRLSILVILALGYVYYSQSTGKDALAAIGLIAFAASAQFLPVIIGGIFWKNATELGAISALIAGFIFWAFTLLIPVFEKAGFISGILDHGLFGIYYLRPENLFGTQGWDPLVHSMFWSYSANIITFILVSLLFKQGIIERLQAASFVDVFRRPTLSGFNLAGYGAKTGELLALSQRILGVYKTKTLFERFSEKGNADHTLEMDARMVAEVERMLAGSIGAASAQIMVSRIAVGKAIGMEEMVKILDETKQVIAYSRELESKSRELEETMERLQSANDKLKRIDKQKDDFLSHVSHELRTPMTSIRSFSEILLESKDIPPEQRSEFLGIIATESQRLTRLLDEILDINLLENGYGLWENQLFCPARILDSAIASLDGLVRERKVKLVNHSVRCHCKVEGDPDRLKQVYINILSNAIKFSDRHHPEVLIESGETDKSFRAVISDNGPGIEEKDFEAIFAKFERKVNDAKGSGLGLAISRQIMKRMKGNIQVGRHAGGGAVFTIALPVTKH